MKLMDAKVYFKDKFEQANSVSSMLGSFQQKNWDAFTKLGLPAIKHEEWKYTKIKNLFRDDLVYTVDNSAINSLDLEGISLPGTEKSNKIVFLNGIFQQALSKINDNMLVVESLEVASNNENKSFVESHLGCSQPYHQDGINALNAAFANGGVFIKVKKGAVLNDPIVIHQVSDCQSGLRFSQPRILASIEESAEATLIEAYHKIGNHESLTNEVIEICVEKEARFRYIKLQNEGKGSNHTGTTQIQQLGKSFTHAVTITLDGGVVRNNLNMIMKAEFGECHLYGLYLLNEDTQADNHTIVDNAVPNCYSNELYKGIMDGKSSGTFNGKIFVRKDAQKTNAYQSNKNILIGDHASANTKPQLEIFADDVKCSHGCTIGKLDEDALFYLRARGISEKNAQAMLLHAFALDIVQQVEIEELKNHIDQLISDRLLFNS
jgi:Fe-S cluster assembly protein SufD